MDLTDIRSQFPALQRSLNGKPIIYLDGPAGSQVPNQVIDAISNYYRTSNANVHGAFATSLETDAVMNGTREKMAVFLKAQDAHCISFGANMTSLNFSLSRALLRSMQAGDEILITQLDHEANRGPWLNLQEHGIVVKEISLLPDCKLDYEDFKSKLSSRTKLVCLGLASNIFGTINDVELVRLESSKVGAQLLIDAVHMAPHYPIDVQKLDCDFLLCSAYKFYGPHIGILYAKPGQLQKLQTDFLRTQSDQAPYRIETGTQNHAAIAGVGAAIDFLAKLGAGNTLREKIESAMAEIQQHEKQLALQLVNGLTSLPQVTVCGPAFEDDRTPTISFTVKNVDPADVCMHLAAHGINAWSGHFYAVRAIEVMNLVKLGGVTRMGMMIYNTNEEIERTVEVLGKL